MRICFYRFSYVLMIYIYSAWQNKQKEVNKVVLLDDLKAKLAAYEEPL